MTTTAVQEKKDIASRFRCLGEQILVRRLDTADEMTAGGLVKPEVSRQRSTRGEIVAVGEGRMIGQGFLPFDLNPGDKIRFSKHGGTELELDGEVLLLMHWKMVFLIETCED